MKNMEIKTICLIALGNILDYYDFLLFAHLGHVIVPFFIPDLNPTEAHLIGMLMFAMPFIVRPLGGYLFGRLSDKKGRACAIQETIKYASLASVGIALLPSYQYGGTVSFVVFLILRAMQGVSLGGEYATAGTFLMERYTTKQGLISGILCASGTVGSLFAFCFAWLYIKNYLTGESWRVAFIIGGIGSYVGILLRKNLASISPSTSNDMDNIVCSITESRVITILSGALVSLLCWLPMVYTNFYFTKILHLPLDVGLQATFISISFYIVFNIIFGLIADMYSPRLVVIVGSLLSMPLGVIGYTLIIKGVMFGQIVLALAASMFGANIHVIINKLFPRYNRSVNVNTSFMLGTSLGGLTPFISGYLVEHYQFDKFPIVMLVTLSILTFIGLYKRFYFINHNTKRIYQ